MYAIVDIAGKQFKVSKGEQINVPKLPEKAGKNVEFDKVLLVSDGDKITVGTPVVGSASVKAKIEDFDREKKVIVFKKKRRKGYQKTQGHRQDFTTLTIKDIAVGATKSKAAKSEDDKSAAKSSTTKTSAAKKSETKKSKAGENKDGA